MLGRAGQRYRLTQGPGEAGRSAGGGAAVRGRRSSGMASSNDHPATERPRPARRWLNPVLLLGSEDELTKTYSASWARASLG